MIREFLNLMIAASCVVMLSTQCLAYDDAHPAAEHSAVEHSAVETAPESDAHAGPVNAVGDQHHPAGDATGSGAHGHDQPYMIGTDLSLWSLVAFIGFCFAIKKLGLWDLMVNSMNDREKSAWQKLDAADAMLTQAETSLRKFRGQFESLEDTVRGLLAEGRRDAEYMQAETIAHAKQEAQTAVGRANYEIERVKDQSLHSLFETLADRVVEATEISLRKQLQAADQDRLIEATLGELVH